MKTSAYVFYFVFSKNIFAEVGFTTPSYSSRGWKYPKRKKKRRHRRNTGVRLKNPISRSRVGLNSRAGAKILHTWNVSQIKPARAASTITHRRVVTWMTRGAAPSCLRVLSDETRLRGMCEQHIEETLGRGRLSSPVPPLFQTSRHSFP